MMSSLLQFQGSDGMWRQLIDHPESWPESSCTGMFAFAFITGVRNGWLDEKVYGEAGRKGWLALVAHLDANSDIRDVCEGTNKKNSLEYYLNRKRLTGDLPGRHRSCGVLRHGCAHTNNLQPFLQFSRTFHSQ